MLQICISLVLFWIICQLLANFVRRNFDFSFIKIMVIQKLGNKRTNTIGWAKMSMNILDPAGQQILDLVHNLGLDIGARLPSERRLSERLGWSRNTVREALAGLAAQGLVVIRPCSGTYVCANLYPRSDDHASFCNAAEALWLIAPALAASTCAQCNENKLALLESHTMWMGQALVDNSFLNTWRGLVAFYRELAVLGGNSLVLDFVDELALSAPVLPHEFDPPIVLGEELQPFFSAHIELLQAIRNSDAEGSTAQASNSISAFRRFLVRRRPADAGP
jgi:GntR family transcriptional regulator, transcriptional repressor for pyruvate dehydrogenase complex